MTIIYNYIFIKLQDCFWKFLQDIEAVENSQFDISENCKK